MTNDLISREALKKELNSRVFQGDYTTTLLLSSFNDLIDSAPAVEAFTENDKALAYCEGYVRESNEAYVRPQGEWKFIQGATTQGSLKCPFCDYRDYHKTNSNFCPNCGADMRKGGAKND